MNWIFATNWWPIEQGTRTWQIKPNLDECFWRQTNQIMLHMTLLEIKDHKAGADQRNRKKVPGALTFLWTKPLRFDMIQGKCSLQQLACTKTGGSLWWEVKSGKCFANMGLDSWGCERNPWDGGQLDDEETIAKFSKRCNVILTWSPRSVSLSFHRKGEMKDAESEHIIILIDTTSPGTHV